MRHCLKMLNLNDGCVTFFLLLSISVSFHVSQGCRQTCPLIKVSPLSCSSLAAQIMLHWGSEVGTLFRIPSKNRCIKACHENGDCRRAIYKKTASGEESCSLLSIQKTSQHSNNYSALTDGAGLQECWLLTLGPCRNCGSISPDQKFCLCPVNYAGRYCEKRSPDYCDSGWKNAFSLDADGNIEEVSWHDLEVVAQRSLEVKVAFVFGTGSTVVGYLSAFRLQGDLYMGQMVDTLGVKEDEGKFGIDRSLLRTFRLFWMNGTVETVVVKKDGSVQEVGITTGAMRLMVRAKVPQVALKVDPITENVMSILQTGATAFSDDFSVVREDGRGTIMSQRMLAEVVVSGDRIATPVTFISSLHDLNRNKTQVLHRQLANGITESFQKLTGVTKWEMDNCWVPVDLDSNGLEDFLIHKVAGGSTIRVIRNDKSVFDVVNVEIGDNILVGTLAPGFASDFSNPTPVKPMVFHALAMTNGLFISCPMNFEFEGEYANKVSYNNTFKWFVSSRNWRNVLELNDTGEVLGGSHTLLRDAVLNGSNIRVYMLTSLSRRCYTSHEVRLESNGEVLVQTYAFIDGAEKVVGDNKAHCRLKRVLFTSFGHINKVRYDHGAYRPSRVSLKHYDRKTVWFAENY